jgi:hypothetical protein
MTLILPGLIPMIAQDQLQRVNEIGFGLFKGFALREDIRQFLKGRRVTPFWRSLVDGCELEMEIRGNHGEGNLVDEWRLFQLKLSIGRKN